MKVINKTKNTIYVDDIDEYLPYNDGQPEEITPDQLKKSQCLRTFILNNMLEVVEYDESERVEASLMFFKKKLEKDEKMNPKPRIEEEQIDDGLPTDLDLCPGIEVKIHDRFKEIQALISGGREDEARAIVNAMTDEEYAAYKRLKNKLQ